MKLDVLAFGAHPDDIELSCSGTLIKLKKMGYKTGVVDLTEGELGTRGSREIRKQEAKNAAEIMGLDVRENLGLPDGNIELSKENELEIIKLIRKYRPSIVIAQSEYYRHPDHKRCYQLVREAAFYAGLRKIETGQEQHRPQKVLYCMESVTFEPTIVVDITDEIEQKMEAIKAYSSQFYRPGTKDKEPQTILSSAGFFDMIRGRASHYGFEIGVAYGEPFYSNLPLPVNDPVLFFNREILM